jgi:hypothetical protein
MLVNIKFIGTTFLLKTGRKANEPLSSANNKFCYTIYVYWDNPANSKRVENNCHILLKREQILND